MRAGFPARGTAFADGVASRISAVVNPLSPWVTALFVLCLHAVKPATAALLWAAIFSLITIGPALLAFAMLGKPVKLIYSASVRRDERLNPALVGPILGALLACAVLVWFAAPKSRELKLFFASSILIFVSSCLLNLRIKCSGHVTSVSALIGLLIVLFGAVGWAMLPLSAAIAWARVRLAVHTVPEVAAGFLTGLLVVLGTYWVGNRLWMST